MANRVFKTYTFRSWHIQRTEQDGKVSFEILALIESTGKGASHEY